MPSLSVTEPSTTTSCPQPKWAHRASRRVFAPHRSQREFGMAVFDVQVGERGCVAFCIDQIDDDVPAPRDRRHITTLSFGFSSLEIDVANTPTVPEERAVFVLFFPPSSCAASPLWMS